MPKTYERREFLAELAKLPCATLLLGVVGPVKALAADADEAYRATDHYYAMGIQLDKCIGCGKCAEACKVENDVPEEPFYFRTWVERYIIYADGEVRVDSPEGGINGFPPAGGGQGDILRTFFVPKLCNHCDNPPCVQVCPVGATFKSVDGVVLVDKRLLHRLSLLHSSLPLWGALSGSAYQDGRQVHVLLSPHHEGSAARLRRGLSDASEDLRRARQAEAHR